MPRRKRAEYYHPDAADQNFAATQGNSDAEKAILGNDNDKVHQALRYGTGGDDKMMELLKKENEAGRLGIEVLDHHQSMHNRQTGDQSELGSEIVQNAKKHGGKADVEELENSDSEYGRMADVSGRARRSKSYNAARKIVRKGMAEEK